MIGRAPMLAAVSLEQTGGGIAVVARLLWDVFQRERGKNARLLTLIEGTRAQPTFAEKTRYAIRLAHAQATGETDFVFYSHLRLAKPLLGMPRMWHRPYGIFLHGIEAWNALPPGHVDLLARAKIRVANSAFTAERVTAAYPHIGPVVPCPLALPGNGSGGGRESNGVNMLPFGGHVVLVVGRMLASERYKGHDELIDAWPSIRDAVPDAQLVFVGLGDDVARLRQKADESRAGSSVVFTGFVTAAERDALYDRAALFALPSRGEGFGLVYLEAMAHRLACVGSVHDAARDVIADGQTGRLVDQSDREQLADTIVTLLKDPAQRTRMGEAGYRRLQTHFSLERFAARFRSLVAADTQAMAS